MIAPGRPPALNAVEAAAWPGWVARWRELAGEVTAAGRDVLREHEAAGVGGWSYRRGYDAHKWVDRRREAHLDRVAARKLAQLRAARARRPRVSDAAVTDALAKLRRGPARPTGHQWEIEDLPDGRYVAIDRRVVGGPARRRQLVDLLAASTFRSLTVRRGATRSGARGDLVIEPGDAHDWATITIRPGLDEREAEQVLRHEIGHFVDAVAAGAEWHARFADYATAELAARAVQWAGPHRPAADLISSVRAWRAARRV